MKLFLFTTFDVEIARFLVIPLLSVQLAHIIALFLESLLQECDLFVLYKLIIIFCRVMDPGMVSMQRHKRNVSL